MNYNISEIVEDPGYSKLTIVALGALLTRISFISNMTVSLTALVYSQIQIPCSLIVYVEYSTMLEFLDITLDRMLFIISYSTIINYLNLLQYGVLPH